MVLIGICLISSISRRSKDTFDARGYVDEISKPWNALSLANDLLFPYNQSQHIGTYIGIRKYTQFHFIHLILQLISHLVSLAQGGVIVVSSLGVVLVLGIHQIL